MNDTATPETNGQNAANADPAEVRQQSYERFENALEAMIIALELFKTHDMPVPSVAMAALNLAGPMMLNTLARKFEWSGEELVARLHEQRRKLNEMADPMAQLGALLETAVAGAPGMEVHAHHIEGEDLDKLKAAIKSGDAKAIDAVITGIVDGKNGQTIAREDNPAQGV